MADAEKQFIIRRIYLKDASFENPLAPEVFRRRTEHSIEMAIRIAHQALDEERYDVTLTCTVTAKFEGQTMFLCEVAQAALATIKGHSPAELEDALNVEVPTLLFPYVRAQISGLTVMGGFAPVVLAPVDFEQMYTTSRQSAAGRA